MKTTEIKLGDLVKDVITGFQGVVICESKWLHGCRRLTLQPEKLKNGEIVASNTFDEPQLKLIKASFVKTTDLTGGTSPEPEIKSTPKRF